MALMVSSCGTAQLEVVKVTGDGAATTCPARGVGVTVTDALGGCVPRQTFVVAPLPPSVTASPAGAMLRRMRGSKPATR